MKDRRNISFGAYDENTQYDSDNSNSNSSNNSQNSITNESNASTCGPNIPENRENLPPNMSVINNADGEENILNKQPITLDLSINAPTRALSNVLITRAFASFDGIGVHSGVPTRTTPTLTPTTLKNINEQTFMEASNDAQMNLPYQAGFVPPPYPIEDQSQDGGVSQESISSNSNGSWHVSGSHGYTADDLDSKSSASLEQHPASTRDRRAAFAAANASSAKSEMGLMDAVGSFAVGSGVATPSAGTNSYSVSGGRRNVGGRRPHKPSNLTPEEEEKRRIRRERNKQAAARCRRRREDHTNELVDETDQLEKKRQSLTQEIQQLQQEKDDLEFLLESHREHCRLQVRRSPIDLKPNEHALETIASFALPKIKTEPVEEFVHQQHQHSAHAHLSTDPVSPDQSVCILSSAKKLKLSNALSDSLETPTPTSIAYAPLSAPGLLGSKSAAIGSSGRPIRPDSLDVKSATQYPSIARGDAAVGNSTPSSGLFNFDSLMEGGTGLTPIAAPINLPPNRNPLELITPTSTEPSKLCSL